MSPKEKATQLITDMLRFQKTANIYIAYEMAVLSAEYLAVCCKEVAGIFDYGNTADEFKHHDKVYWEQVQKELNELK